MIHCTSIPDKEILEALEDSRDVLLLGCSICANISYCIEKDMKLPMYNWLLNPVCVKSEMDRLQSVLRENNISTSSLVLLSLCFISIGDYKKLQAKCEGIDAILALSCDYGRDNIEDLLKGRRIYCAMKMKGFMRTAVERKGLKLIIDRERLYINNQRYEDIKKQN